MEEQQVLRNTGDKINHQCELLDYYALDQFGFDGTTRCVNFRGFFKVELQKAFHVHVK